ncbi:alpha/beta hydrolase [Siculibacillus lacustris]|uniref:Alpha/beta hydrolase n=1 Tax=Siculibacillus lacustris TaxID=1549641 RepID=A0A4V2KTZ6_9HYPH|nr:alpha/beta family hydrolase [Siculibacillus lacustris]TBW39295.1 alpha/beta hydrolase [Siculibacillus lacustris]
MPDFLWTTPDDARATVLLAHGAGAPMDSSFMTRIAEGLGTLGVAVARFEFDYMAKRRTTGKKRPPPKAETLVPAFAAAAVACAADPRCVGPLIVGGKSMGGRIAAMAAGLPLDPRVAGVACLGYPFHGPGRPEEIRLAPLQVGLLPVLVLQGERDEFGNRAEVEALAVGDRVRFEWIPDGSHDFGPPGASPATLKTNIQHACTTLAAFALAFVGE